MRIAFLCEQYPPIIWDGVGVYTHDIAHALARRGHEVHVLCTQGRSVRDDVYDGVHVHRRPLLRIPVSRYLGHASNIITDRNNHRE
jgi:glycosyltransferase involved in cell wall biosynthesis